MTRSQNWQANGWVMAILGLVTLKMDWPIVACVFGWGGLGCFIWAAFVEES